MPDVCKIWKSATDTQKLPEGVKSDLKISSLENGSILVDWRLSVPKGLAPLPRAGLSFTIPDKYVNVTWYGMGPWENYCDRSGGSILGIYKGTVGLVSGVADSKSGNIIYPSSRLNTDNYTEPGEQGYRTGCRWLKLSDTLGKAITVTALNTPFGFNAWPYPQSALEGVKHQYEIKKADKITVNIDAAQMGVGGDDSWGARPLEKYMLNKSEYRLVFTVDGLITK